MLRAFSCEEVMMCYPDQKICLVPAAQAAFSTSVDKSQKRNLGFIYVSVCILEKVLYALETV